MAISFNAGQMLLPLFWKRLERAKNENTPFVELEQQAQVHLEVWV